MFRKHSIRIVYILILLIFISVFTGCSHLNPVMKDGLTIAGVPVGGLRKEEAISVINDYVQQTYQTRNMCLQINGQTFYLSPEETKFQLDTVSAVETAFSEKASGTFDISPFLTLDITNIRNTLEQLHKTHFSSTLTEYTYALIGEEPDLSGYPTQDDLPLLTLHMGTPEIELDVEALLQEIINAYSSGVFLIEYETEVIAPKQPNANDILQQIQIEPVDAVMDMETFEITPHRFGYTIDLDQVTNAIQSAEYGDVIEIPLLLLQPNTTIETLSSILYRDVLSTHTATASSQWGRDINLRLSCEAINGIILMPGEVFSYNPALGERTPDKGWKKADGYSGMETVSEYGGGICQASSCLYLCAMLADMEIVERTNHGFISSYMPYGMDATVSWGGPEFRFRNNSEYPIRIEAYSSGGSVTVSLIGTDTKDYYVKMEYEVIKTDPYETVEQEFPADNPEGYIDGQVIITPYTGYEIITYRCKYNKETDELISRKQEAVSKYSRRDKVICKIVDPSIQSPPESEVTP